MGEERPPGRPRYTKFYWKDFISDTQHLTPSQLGAYIRLLAHAVMCSDDFCSIPDDSPRQARITGVDYRNWRRIQGDVRRLFGDAVSGRCQQKRLMEDASAWAQHCEKQRLRRTAGQPPDYRGSTGTRPEHDHTRSREKSEVRSQIETEDSTPPAQSHANGVAKARPASGPRPVAEGFASLPTNTNGDWHATPDEIGAFANAYPGVELKATFNEMRAWLIANPTRRKTFNGMPRFVNSWLAREQNRP